MRFRFHMDRILSLVRLQETMKRLEVANQQERLRALKRRRAECEERIPLLLREMQEMGISVGWREYQTQKIALDRLGSEVLQEKIATESLVLEKVRKELEHLFKKRKALESLRDKKKGEFRKFQSRREQKTTDGINR